MRDEQDPGTLELTLPRKRGRPPTFGYAMTDAQRAARYRARRAGQAGHADVRNCQRHRMWWLPAFVIEDGSLLNSVFATRASKN